MGNAGTRWRRPRKRGRLLLSVRRWKGPGFNLQAQDASSEVIAAAQQGMQPYLPTRSTASRHACPMGRPVQHIENKRCSPFCQLLHRTWTFRTTASYYDGLSTCDYLFDERIWGADVRMGFTRWGLQVRLMGFSFLGV